jgi:signal transduction histidine kinase
MRRALSLVLLLIASLLASAQVKKRDSLFKLLSESKKDTSRVMLLLRIADTYETNNQDSSVYYLTKSKNLSEELNFKMGLYHYYENSAIVSFTKGDYDLAMKQSNKALEEAKELKDSNLIVNMLNNTGIVYSYLGQFDKQLDYTLQALKLSEKLNKKEKLASLYHSVGNAYYNLNQFNKAIDYWLLAVKLHKQPGTKIYLNRLYASLGQGYTELKVNDSALHYYKLAISESVKSNDTYAEAAIYGFMVNLYADLGNYKEMLTVAEKSLVLSKKLQSNQILASSLYNVAYANYFNDNNISAKKNLDEALVLAINDSLTDELKNIYSIYSFIAARDGDFKKSLWAKSKYDSIQKFLLSDRIIKNSSDFEKKYEVEKKNKQLLLQEATLAKRSFLIKSLIGSTITLLVIFLSVYFYYKGKQKLQAQKIRELEKEKQLAATEAVLKGEAQERSRLAKDLHDGLGGMLSGIKYSFQTMKGNLIMTPENQQAFERSMDMLDSSIKEMRRVAHNMMPESLVRFGLDTALKDYCTSVSKSGALQVSYQSIGLANYTFDQTMAISVYRIIQELIGNTLKHGAAKNAIVQVTKSDNLLAVTVEDDGKGFDTNMIELSKGIGYTNIKNRVDFLKGKLDINSEEGKGTSVHIEFEI